MGVQVPPSPPKDCMLVTCTFVEATYVRLQYVGITNIGPVRKIVAKWGAKDGHLSKPSEGGFGCILEDGTQVDMWNASAYYRDVDEPGPGWA